MGLTAAAIATAAAIRRLRGSSERYGLPVALAALSACLSLSIGWLVTWPVYALLCLGLVYSFAAIGDSPVLSVALTEVVGPGFLGVVLALRSVLGFVVSGFHVSPL